MTAEEELAEISGHAADALRRALAYLDGTDDGAEIPQETARQAITLIAELARDRARDTHGAESPDERTAAARELLGEMLEASLLGAAGICPCLVVGLEDADMGDDDLPA